MCYNWRKNIDNIFDKVDLLKRNSKVDIIIGGPPCQAYSVAGRARFWKKVEKDPRNELYKYYVQFIKRYDPEMFVFENVLGLLTAKRGEPFADLKRLVEELASESKFHAKFGLHKIIVNFATI